MNEQLAETLHRFSYIQNCKRASALGLSEVEYKGMRRRMVQKFTETLHALMQEANTTDPVSILPDALASVCEEAIIEARKVAKESARHEIQKRWLKAAQP